MFCRTSLLVEGFGLSIELLNLSLPLALEKVLGGLMLDKEKPLLRTGD